MKAARLAARGAGRAPRAAATPARPRASAAADRRARRAATRGAELARRSRCCCSPAPGRRLFVVAYALDWSTQALGGALAAALALLAAALIVLGERLVVTEELDEAYPRGGRRPRRRPRSRRSCARAASRITRKRLLRRRPGIAGGALGLASSRPPSRSARVFDTSRLNETPWRRGRRLVDERRAAAVTPTRSRPARSTPPSRRARDRDAIASPLVLVRLDPVDAAAARGTRRLGARRASSPTRRSARTPAARSRCTATRCSSRSSPSTRSSARATTRRSTWPTAARCCSGPPGGRCRSCR